ncbi:CsbD family protein [Bogoriella caseilytica]|uniref:CsbD-like protein n=1 Tax=Bogoriella caseilytica TaxID=56055 RepID=A0A3N2BBD0_9MICO|nr:CsbD family protein [Bogoriella caseilytica]ROR72482.1 CsbD-like protein [Bogoriella caseilytica]
MGTDDKARNSAQENKGKLKEGVGDAIGNEQMQAEGKADQSEGALKQAGEKVKDVFK